MNNIKRIIAVVLVLSLAIVFAACSMNQAGQSSSASSFTIETTADSYKGETIGIAAAEGIASASLLYLLSNKNYSVELTPDDASSLSQLTGGKADIAVCSLSEAAKLYAKNDKIRILGITGLSSYSAVSSSGDVKNLSALEGKDVYCAEQGGADDAAFSYVLKMNGLEGKVNIKYAESFDKICEGMTAGSIEVAFLPEPYASVAVNSNSKAECIFSLSDELKKLDTISYFASFCAVTTVDFIKSNPEAVSQFSASIKDSVEGVNLGGSATLKELVSKKVFPESAVAGENDEDKKDSKKVDAKNQSAVIRCNVVYAEGEKLPEIGSQTFKFLYELDPAFIGDREPNDAIYFIA